jgi:hypothetical protein
MYTDIPEWTDYLYWWGRFVLVAIAIVGVCGGLVYLWSL